MMPTTSSIAPASEDFGFSILDFGLWRNATAWPQFKSQSSIHKSAGGSSTSQSKIQNRKSKMDTSLIDDRNITWIRQRCRCCGAVLWEVLGDPVGLCRNCAITDTDPLGILRLERDAEQLHWLHTVQYHGACAVDV
jgi:hypothetical protein